MRDTLLKFGQGNAKLGKYVATFALPAGHTCPFADRCHSRADRTTGKITDGPHTVFRCYAASLESIRTNIRANFWHNLEALQHCRSRREMSKLILASLPHGATMVRFHTHGDFFSQTYFDAWLEVAEARPGVTFYGYTKSLRFWARRLDQCGNGYRAGTIANFILTASDGGKDDALISQLGLRQAIVVGSENDASKLGLPLDHDDSHAQKHGESFALLIHGPQPAGSAMSKALAALRAQGEYGYGRKANERRMELKMV